MTTTPSPPPPPSSHTGTTGTSARRLAIVGVLLVVIAGLAAAAGLVLVNRGDDSQAAGDTSSPEYVVMDTPRAEPVFEPAGSSGADAFYPVELQLTSFQQEVERDAERQALELSEGAEEGQVVDPDQLPEFDVAALQAEAKTGIFGGTAENTCNPERLISFLYANPDLGEAWAHVQGIEFSEIASYIRSLEVRVLAEPVAVLNHGFDPTSGAAYEVDSVLAAGTAVLVDENGDIRTRCFCGNPIRPRPEPASMPPRCLVYGGLVYVTPAGSDRREGLPSPLDVLLTGSETTIGGERWIEIKWGTGADETGWTLASNLRKHYCPPPTNYDYDCPGEGTVNTWVDPERTVKAGEVTGTVITGTGPEAIFAPISPVGGPGGEVIFNDSLLIRFTQAFPSVQNSAWVHLDDLTNNDCHRIQVCISTDGPVRDRMNGAIVAPALTMEFVDFTGHFAKDPISHAEIRLFDGAGTTGWIADSYTTFTDAECRETPDKPVVDCAEGSWVVWETSTANTPPEAVGTIANTEILVFPTPAENGRKLVQMGLPGSSVGPTGWVDQNAFRDGHNHCGAIPLCVSTTASAWSEHPNGGSEIAPFIERHGVKLHDQWVYTNFFPVEADRLLETGGASGWIPFGNYTVHWMKGECEDTPPSNNCPTVETPDPTNGQDPYPESNIAFDIVFADVDDRPGPSDEPGDSSTKTSVCCIEGPIYFMAGGPGHLDTIGAFWVELSGATEIVAGETWFETTDGLWFAESQIVSPDRCVAECPSFENTTALNIVVGNDDDTPEDGTPENGCCVTALYNDNDFGALPIDVGLGVFVDVVGGPIFSDGADWYLTSDGYWFPASARTVDSDCTSTRCPVPQITVNIVLQTDDFDPSGCCIGGWADTPGGDIINPLQPERVELTGDRLIADGQLWFETTDGRWVPEDLFQFTTDCDNEPVGDPSCPEYSVIEDAPLAAGTLCCVSGAIYTQIVDGFGRDIDTPTAMSVSGPSQIHDGTPWFPVAFEGTDYWTPQGNFTNAEDCAEEASCPEASIIADAQAIAFVASGCCISGSASVPNGNVAARATGTPGELVQLTGTVDDSGAWFETTEGRWVPADAFAPASDCEPRTDPEPQPEPRDPAPQPEPQPDPAPEPEPQPDPEPQPGPEPECIDVDEDEVCDPVDNCVGIWNPDQADADNDGIGSVCDGSEDVCPSNQRAGNGECCPTDLAVTSDGCFPYCDDGTINYGQDCPSVDPTVVCPDGTVVPESQGCPVYCPDGSIDNGNGCPPTCPEGFTQVGNDCVSDCPDGTPRTTAGCPEYCDDGTINYGEGCPVYCPDGTIDNGQDCDPCYPSVDRDGDGICDDVDPCPTDSTNIDSDGDGACDSRDTCPLLPDYSTNYPQYLTDEQGNRVGDCTELI